MNKPRKPLLIKRGPQFNGIISTIGLYVSIIALISSLITISNGNLAFFGYSILSLFVGFGAFLDIRGVVLDFKNNRIMEYRSFWGYKHGVWEPLNQFKRIVLTYESVRTGSYTSNNGNQIATSSYSYCIVLKGEKGGEVLPLELVEFASHKAGRKKLLELASVLNLPYYDVFHEKSLSAQKRRYEHEVDRFFKKH